MIYIENSTCFGPNLGHIFKKHDANAVVNTGARYPH